MANDKVRIDSKEMVIRLYKEIRLMKHTAKALCDMCQDSENDIIKQCGLVSEDTNNSQVSNKSDVISISKAVAAEWLELADKINFENDIRLVEEIKKALSEGSAR